MRLQTSVSLLRQRVQCPCNAQYLHTLTFSRLLVYSTPLGLRGSYLYTSISPVSQRAFGAPCIHVCTPVVRFQISRLYISMPPRPHVRSAPPQLHVSIPLLAGTPNTRL